MAWMELQQCSYQNSIFPVDCDTKSKIPFRGMIDAVMDQYTIVFMPNIRKLISFVLLISLTACNMPVVSNLFNHATPTPQDTSTPTPLPTATPTPIPTATPTPQPSARLDSGMQAFLDGDYDTAISEFQTAYDFSQDPEIKAQAQNKLARIAYLQGDTQKALDLDRQVTEASVSATAGSEAHYYLAQIYTSLKRSEDAAAEYQLYLDSQKSSPISAYILELQGDAYTDAGQYQKAIDAFGEASKQPDADASLLNLKIAGNDVTLGETAAAMQLYNNIFNTTQSDYVRAQVDLLVGQIYLTQDEAQNAYDRFKDAVNNYPRAYDSYSALVALVNDGVEVSDLNRGIVDYYAGKYTIAADVLKTYIKNNQIQDGTPHYYRAMALTQTEDYEGAIAEWDALIQQNNPADRFWATSWDEKAYTQWYYLGKFDLAAQTLSDFISKSTQDTQAPSLLFETGRIYERNNELDLAVAAWERLPNEYPGSEYSYMGIYFAGITRYRQQRYTEAQTDFQRASLLGVDSSEKAGANFWMGKSAQANGDSVSAQNYWQNAMSQDPTGYYSERARDLTIGRKPYEACKVLDLGINLEADRPEAEAWLTKTFSLPVDTNYSDLGSILSDGRIQRAAEYWRLGLYEKAITEVEAYRDEFKADPLIQYKIGRWALSLGIFRSAILANRQVLTLAGLDDNGTLTAPIYFNHVRFGPYYRNIITQVAQENNLDPLLIYSVIRQESMFDTNISSSAGADGLMQMLPTTAREVSSQSGRPPVFLDDDIFRPQVAISLGSYYLAQQIRLQGGDLYAGLAAYNGGPGNATAWKELSQSDPDLFLEVVRYQETRDYLRAILEIFNIYKSFYCR
jgi:soluble lytic murein transglycosylase